MDMGNIASTKIVVFGMQMDEMDGKQMKMTAYFCRQSNKA